MWDDDPRWTLPAVEGKKAKEKGKNSDSFYGNLVLGRYLPWTPHGVEGKKAERKIEKSPTHFMEISVWDHKLPLSQPGIEGKKAEEKTFHFT